MEKRKAFILLVVVAALLLAAARPIPGPRAIVSGELRKAYASVCEHPWYPGFYLLYHVANDCGDELFFHGNLNDDQVGYHLWAEGILLQNGSCQVLEISSYSVCMPPGPPNDS